MAENKLSQRDNVQIMALSGEGLGLTAEEIAEEMGGDLPEFTRVKIPAGGAVAFEIPGDDPEEPEYRKELEGVIVWHHKANAYWSDGLDSSGNPPDCSSSDGISGEGLPGGLCEHCPHNQFGSGEGGRGKACKNMFRLYLLLENGIFPIVLTLPPTSLGAWKTYRTSLIMKGQKVCNVLTKITLARKESNGNAYAAAVFKNAGELPEDFKKAAAEYRAGIRAMTESGFGINHETGELL